MPNEPTLKTKKAETAGSPFPFDTTAAKSKSNAIEIPALNLPKGGGAIRSIDEKFSVNAVNGSASLNIPLPASEARGFSPALALSYNSASGNGIFGLGWSLTLPSIKRKTDHELPQYFDKVDSDTYLFTGAEDLVPEFKKEPDGKFSLDVDGNYIIKETDTTDGKYTIRFYKPRIEGSFARIERWSGKTAPEIKWRVITKENVTTLLGWSAASRIYNPKDETKIFEWLPEFTYDDKGNCAQYVYQKEDREGFKPSLLHHRNRLENGAITYTNLYLKKILSGNHTPYKKFNDPFPLEADYFFQTIFDYGDYNPNPPYQKINPWNFREDAFSEYKAGFEIRTTRLCQRILLFHYFKELPGGSALVKSLNLEYDTPAETGAVFLKSITAFGYIKKPDGTYSAKNLPPLEFQYQKHEWNQELKTFAAADLVHAPAGLDEPTYQFTDLFNEGLVGILTEQGAGWFYKHNLGDGKFEPARLVAPKPSFMGLGTQVQLMDLEADGGKQLVNLNQEPKGFFELNDAEEWQPFRTFEHLPYLNLKDPNTRLLDLNGDGRPDILITEDQVFTWYESAGRTGFTGARHTMKPSDEEAGPSLVFADLQQTIFLADMSGDGLTDIVRIRNGEVCYWPNLGYGNFGRKVNMDQAPVFDHPDSFNPSFLRLADIDGSGTTDIIYLGKNKFSCWLNLSGNAFSATPFEFDFPEIHNQAKITVTDLLGAGVACIVWSSNLAKDARSPLRYIDLMNSKKPHLMVSYQNNLGREVSFEYTPSTKFYIEDKLAGRPWVTKLHFPVHCLSKTETRDRISGYRFVSSYKYHHGYYDHAEREFRGFGLVEKTDTENFDHWVKGNANNIVSQELHQDPVLTKSWFHTGAFLGKGEILNQFRNDYWDEEMKRKGLTVVNPETPLPDPSLIAAPGLDASIIDHLSAQEWREALRACKGMGLRSEVFAKDAPPIGATLEERRKELTPYSVSTHNCMIELLQPQGQNKHAIFMVKESEALTYNYERNTADPRIAHNLNITFDEYGNVLESAAVVYPRMLAAPSLPMETQAAQNQTLIIYTQNHFTNDINTTNEYRLRLPSEVKTYELKGVPKANPLYKIAEFENILTAAIKVEYPQIDIQPAPGKSQQRLIEHQRNAYYNYDLTGPLAIHQLESKGLLYESYQLAYTPALMTSVFGARVNDALMLEGKFIHSEGDDCWWIRSGRTQFIEGTETVNVAQNRFYKPISYTDPYGAKTKVKYYGDYFLFIAETEDAVGNKASVDLFNFRTLAPQRMKDANLNLSEAITDELGLVKATAIFGKGAEADDLTGLNEFTAPEELTLIHDFFTAPTSDQLVSRGKNLLGHATTRFIYDLAPYRNSGKPAVVASIIREQHFQNNHDSPIQLSFEYSNGMGQVVMKKVQAEPGVAKQALLHPDNTYTITEVDTGAVNPKQLRWIGNGRIVLNNKGNAVKQYEPYFSVTPGYEDLKELIETGVTPILYYDALGRLIKTAMPDGAFSKTLFDSWKQSLYDPNDTIRDSSWYLNRTNHLIDAELIAAGKNPDREKVTADKAAKHHGTPLVKDFDVLGRPVLSVEHNKNVLTGADEFYYTKADLDLEGNLRTVTDSRNNVVMRYQYDMLGHQVYQNSMDAGQRWLLTNILGNPLRAWDERKHEFQYLYDILGRPSQSKVTGGDGDIPLNHIFARVFYGEAEFNPEIKNLRGRVVKSYDTGGVIETPEYDFKGQPLSTTRKLFKDYKHTVNWIDANLVSALEPESYIFITQTDALGRITRQTAPDSSVITPSYNEAGLLNGESVTHPAPAMTTTYIKDIDYNEKGQRIKIVYGNNVTTKYYYDKETFRLKRLESRRQNNDLLQDWYYTYDPAGNITYIEDKNIPALFFNNQRVAAVSTYTYDALYRLVEATGRENDSILAFEKEDNWNDAAFLRQLNPGDPMAVRNYTQNYQYDAAGNILEMRHQAVSNNWTRNYSYQASNNRLISAQVGANTYTYPHHSQHGFMTALPHLQEMGWNFKEELVKTIRQRRVDGGTPETTYYQYDGQGRRIRKISENQADPGKAPDKKDERIYIAGYELYKKHSGANAGLARVSLSLMDKEHRFVIIEIRNDVNDGTDKYLARYQLHNHLGSASLELDGSNDAQVISYEEYHPFGTTAYQARNAGIKSTAKRYRYTGMERDEETGLEYHQARYYLPWMGRWLSADPGGLVDGVNLYRYGRNNPVILNDPNGMDPPSGDEQLVRYRSILTDTSPLGPSGTADLVTGLLPVSGGVRSSYMLNIPSLDIDTTGILDASASGSLDTTTGVSWLALRGGGLLGEQSGLHLLATGTGTVQIPTPGNDFPPSLEAALPGAVGEVRLNGALQAGSFLLADIQGRASLDSGRFTTTLDAVTLWNLGRLHLEGTGTIDSSGAPSFQSFFAKARAGVPGIVTVDAQGSGTANPDGSFSVTGSAALRFFGIPSIEARGKGILSRDDSSFSGTFSGPGPLYTSYITGDFSLGTRTGISASALIAGVTYTPSISISMPPVPPGIEAVAGSPKAPWEPGGLTFGLTYINYSHGAVSWISGGIMPELNSNIFTNFRAGLTLGVAR